MKVSGIESLHTRRTSQLEVSGVSPGEFLIISFCFEIGSNQLYFIGFGKFYRDLFGVDDMSPVMTKAINPAFNPAKSPPTKIRALKRTHSTGEFLVII